MNYYTKNALKQMYKDTVIDEYCHLQSEFQLLQKASDLETTNKFLMLENQFLKEKIELLISEHEAKVTHLKYLLGEYQQSASQTDGLESLFDKIKGDMDDSSAEDYTLNFDIE